MSEFNLVQTPPRGPTTCFFCGEFEGPFIDTYVDAIAHGAIYICAPNEKRPGCLGQMATLAGFLNSFEKARLEARLAQAEQTVADLKQMVSSMDEVKQLRALFEGGRGITAMTEEPFDPTQHPAYVPAPEEPAAEPAAETEVEPEAEPEEAADGDEAEDADEDDEEEADESAPTARTGRPRTPQRIANDEAFRQAVLTGSVSD